MTINVLRNIISDLILENAEIRIEHGEDPRVHNTNALADLILKRIQETHFICEPSDAIRIAAAAIDHSTNSTEARSSWEGHVDRQSGAFTDQEIADSNRWR